MQPLRIGFDRGTLRIDAPGRVADALPYALWDDRVGALRAPGFRYTGLLSHLERLGGQLDDAVGPQVSSRIDAFRPPALRPYQADALAAFHAAGSRGVAVLPTGAGKTRLAIAAMAHARRPSLVLCPTRALLEQWRDSLRAFYDGPIGVVGDGERTFEPVTVMTFESAMRCLDRHGDRYGVLVVDEVHHFASGARAEALEMCVAPVRLGLTATAPQRGSAGEARLTELLGPVVCEVRVRELVGTHLAELELVRLGVRLDDAEAAAYEAGIGPFAELCRAFFREHPGADFAALVRALGRTSAGRRALAGRRHAAGLAQLPRAKRELLDRLLARHRDDKVLVFTADAEDAYAIARAALVPVVCAEVGRAERRWILERFRDGRVRCIVSARVLNEGIDVPDASVAILVAGALGAREYVQRVGRVLRPAAGKRAIVYELVTTGTVDDVRSRARARALAP